VAEADLLGVLGREGVYAATAWPLQGRTTGNFLIAAFDLYRSYDGNGAIVGDLAVQANTTDNKNTSVYAFAHSDGSAGRRGRGQSTRVPARSRRPSSLPTHRL
jgi:mannan endo-1,4-beta-mannosidase